MPVFKRMLKPGQTSGVNLKCLIMQKRSVTSQRPADIMMFPEKLFINGKELVNQVVKLRLLTVGVALRILS